MKSPHDEVNPFAPPAVPSTAPPSVEDETSGQVEPGIRGWLILPAIGLTVGPFISLAQIYGYTAETVQLLPEIEEAYPGYTVAYWGTLLLEVLFVAYVIYVATFFFRWKRATPRLMTYLYAASLLLAAIECLWFGFVDEELLADLLRPVMQTMIGAAIWIPYFRLSQRVKRTFVR